MPLLTSYIPSLPQNAGRLYRFSSINIVSGFLITIGAGGQDTAAESAVL